MNPDTKRQTEPAPCPPEPTRFQTMPHKTRNGRYSGRGKDRNRDTKIKTLRKLRAGENP